MAYLKSLSNYDIDSVLGKINGYLGTFSKDLMEHIKLPKNTNSFAVINMQDSNAGNGTHWVCYFNKPSNNYIYYFDSYGILPPHNTLKWLKTSNKKILYNTSHIQNFSSSSCGYYCLIFIYWMLNNEKYLDFVQLFENNGDVNFNNEKTLNKLLNHYNINTSHAYIKKTKIGSAITQPYLDIINPLSNEDLQHEYNSVFSVHSGIIEIGDDYTDDEIDYYDTLLHVVYRRGLIGMREYNAQTRRIDQIAGRHLP